VGTTVLVKAGKARYAWTTILPLAFVLVVTLTAGWQKIFAADPRLGFLSQARATLDRMAAGTFDHATGARIVFNYRLDAVVSAVFMTVTVLLVIASVREWVLIVRRRRPAVSRESPFVESAYAG
jgi:carbon starvation protein